MAIVPCGSCRLLSIAAFVLYCLHAQSKGARKDLSSGWCMLGLMSLFVFTAAPALLGG